jgi:hypothetical protein
MILAPILAVAFIMAPRIAHGQSVLLSKEGPYKVSKGEEVKFTFPPVLSGKEIRLAWEARMDYKRQGGSHFHLEIELNGHEVGAMLSRRQARLLNKPVGFRDKNQVGYWYAEGGGWRIAYSPDFGLVRKAIGHSEDDYGFVIDVTDLCNSAKGW